MRSARRRTSAVSTLPGGHLLSAKRISGLFRCHRTRHGAASLPIRDRSRENDVWRTDPQAAMLKATSHRIRGLLIVPIGLSERFAYALPERLWVSCLYVKPKDGRSRRPSGM